MPSNELKEALVAARIKRDEVRSNSKPIKFPLDFYPIKEQNLIKGLALSKGLSMQHVGLGMLPVFSRLYNMYKAKAFNGDFEVMPIFWVGIIDEPGSAKTQSLEAWHQPLSKLNDFSDPENYNLYSMTDTTPEGLVTTMKDKTDGLYLFYDEISSFIAGIGQYKKTATADKGFWLKMFGGSDNIQARVGGGIRHMKGQAISVAGTSQPETIRSLFEKSDMTNGFFDRFLWSIENNPIPDLNKNSDYGISERIRLRIGEHIEATKFDTTLKFTDQARDMLYDWYYETRDAIGNDRIKRQFFGKDVIYINRFALIAHIIHEMGDSSNIDCNAVTRAIALYNFCNKMRERVYNLINQDELTYSMLSDQNIARHLAAEHPNVEKHIFSEMFEVSRQTIYNWINLE